MKYKTWLWWTRFAMVITILQFVGATYLIFHVAKHTSNDGTSNDCVLGVIYSCVLRYPVECDYVGSEITCRMPRGIMDICTE
uniref:DUF7358 domain-containing protein n=1 Tax=Vitis vinifera TaxID=29760 RepID=F6I3R3_VITVI